MEVVVEHEKNLTLRPGIYKTMGVYHCKRWLNGSQLRKFILINVKKKLVTNATTYRRERQLRQRFVYTRYRAIEELSLFRLMLRNLTVMWTTAVIQLPDYTSNWVIALPGNQMLRKLGGKVQLYSGDLNSRHVGILNGWIEISLQIVWMLNGI